MKVIEEINIRKLADSPAVTMLDSWKDLTMERFGKVPEVMIGDRKEHPQLKSFPGSINLAYPHKVRCELRLPQ